MHGLRAFLLKHRRGAILLLALALCMKALLPGGYMLGQHGKVLTVEICADASGAKLTKQIVLPAKDAPAPQSKSDGTCAYGALGMAALAGADILLLGVALAFILALGFAAIAPVAAIRPIYLRPPLRGPPARF